MSVMLDTSQVPMGPCEQWTPMVWMYAQMASRNSSLSANKEGNLRCFVADSPLGPSSFFVLILTPFFFAKAKAKAKNKKTKAKIEKTNETNKNVFCLLTKVYKVFAKKPKVPSYEGKEGPRGKRYKTPRFHHMM